MEKKKGNELCRLYMSGSRLHLQLKDLTGYHYLSGCEPGMIGEGTDSSVNYLKFILDEKIYIAMEDPDDGYRSAMDSICLDLDGKVNNTFQSVLVYCYYDGSGGDDLLHMQHALTGDPIISVGTDRSDDYYPCFTQHFFPQCLGIPINRCKNCICRNCFYYVKGECMGHSASSCEGLIGAVKESCAKFITHEEALANVHAKGVLI